MTPEFKLYAKQVRATAESSHARCPLSDPPRAVAPRHRHPNTRHLHAPTPRPSLPLVCRSSRTRAPSRRRSSPRATSWPRAARTTTSCCGTCARWASRAPSWRSCATRCGAACGLRMRVQGTCVVRKQACAARHSHRAPTVFCVPAHPPTGVHHAEQELDLRRPERRLARRRAHRHPRYVAHNSR